MLIFSYTSNENISYIKHIFILLVTVNVVAEVPTFVMWP